ncbi:MAG TPA: copper chaperone PCu(A)C [Methyloceanibacter sp.]|nr:copper chaperone PCu(A)C [Methyloceanibacter sp.]
MCRLRKVEIGVAVALTMAALMFVAWTAWAAQPGGISVSDAWVRPTIGEGKTTAAYMTITNKGDGDDVLRSARSPKAKMVELHQTTMTDEGVMRMRPVEGGLSIPAGATLELSPGGNHLMIMGLDDALADGGALPLTLDFSSAGSVEITVPVRKGGGKGSGAGHAGH